MLTQIDLQAIGKILDDKLNPLEARMDSFEGKLSSLETKLTKKIDSLDKKINFLDKRVNSLDNKMNRGFKSVDRKLDVIINYFDHQDIDIRKRLNRIELHIGIAPLNS